MIKETYTTTHVDVPKSDGTVFRITVRGSLTPEDSHVLRAMEACLKMYDLLSLLTPIAREQVDNDLYGGAVGMSDELEALHQAEEFIESMERAAAEDLGATI